MSPPSTHYRNPLSRDSLLEKVYGSFEERASGLAAAIRDCRDQRLRLEARIDKLESLNLRLVVGLVVAGTYSGQEIVRNVLIPYLMGGG